MPKSNYIDVQGLRTHYLEAGQGGSPLLLLHSGEFGGCAESSWRHIIPELASHGHHVLAPDWLGFGRSDKVIDFADPSGRRLRHMAGFIEAMGWDHPVIVGNSMGGSYLVRELAKPDGVLRASVAIVVSGGGYSPDNEARRIIQDYDLSLEGMRKIIDTLLYADSWAMDNEYIAWRHELSMIPGAWQCAQAARLRPPRGPSERPVFGQSDVTQYENIACPTLLIAGADDPLRLPGYATEIAERIPDCRLAVYEECGHMPNIEHSGRFVQDVIAFLRDRSEQPRNAAL